MNNLIRPFQRIVLVDESTMEKLQWSVLTIEDLFDITKLYSSLGDDHFQTVLRLNHMFKVTCEDVFGIEEVKKNKLLVSSEELLKMWKEQSEIVDNDNKRYVIRERLRKVEAEYLLEKIKKNQDNNDITDSVFKIIHDGDFFYVILQNGSIGAMSEKFINRLTREIVEKLCTYRNYWEVSSSLWFYQYLRKL